MKFNKLLVPEGYRHYWSKYPEGYTILEALLNWVDSVNRLTDNVNDWNIYLEDFVENFDEKLAPTVREMLNEMEQDGRLADIINENIFDELNNKINKKPDKEYVNETIGLLNIKDFGAVGDGVTSDVDAIIDASESGHTIGFPNGVYVVDKHIEIKNKNIHWVALGDNVVILDVGRDLPFGSLGELTVAHGIRFSECDVKIDGIAFDSVVRSSGGVPYNEQNYDQVIPKLDFYHCENVQLFNLYVKGQTGTYTSGVLDNTNIHNHAYELMRGSYIRIFNCDRVLVDGYEQLSGSGGGEMLSFNRCRRVTLKNSKHFQGNAGTTFWSFAKIIECDKIVVDGLDIQSRSSGSLIDISGDHIVYENIVADYPNGKFLDITQEWRYANVESGTYEIRNSLINSGTLAFNSLANGVGLKPVDRVIIENVLHPKEMEVSPLISLPITKNIEIRNQKIFNRYQPCALYLIPDNEYVFTEHIKHINLLFDNVEIKADQPATNNLILLETKGTTTIKDSLIDLNHTNRLEFRDRTADLSAGLKPDADKKFIVEDTHFKNTNIYIRANITFKNCTFDDCVFDLSNHYFRPEIIFNDSEIIVRKDSVYTNDILFRMYSPSRVTLNNVKIHGEHYNINGYPLFRGYGSIENQTSVNIDYLEISDCEFDVVRLTSSDEIHSTPTPVTNIGDTLTDRPQDIIHNIKINNVDLRGSRLFTLIPSNASPVQRMISITNSNQLGVARLVQASAGERDFNGYKFLIKNNNFGSDSADPNSISYYENLLTNAGAEVIFEGNYKL